MWRVSLGLGALPGVVMVFFRCRMKETAAFTAVQAEKERRKRAAEESDAASDAPPSLRAASLSASRETAALLWGSRWDLLATAGNWWLFDVVLFATST